jgi:peptidoglycan/xylan/chitin deacetylase (PgdA/CDA1 family)
MPGLAAIKRAILLSHIILNFHGVGPVSRNIDDGERNCWLEQDTLEAVLDLARGQAHVQLTFDDGNASDAEIVLPALLRRGLQARFFICSGRLDQPTFLSQAQVRELLAQGMGVGSHGIAHRSWRHLPSAGLREEIAGSRRVLESICGIAVDTAACPFGAYDRAVLKALRQAVYRQVYTSDGGVSAENHWLQARTTVTRSMTLSKIQRLVQQGPGAWERLLIDARKLFKRLR